MRRHEIPKNDPNEQKIEEAIERSEATRKKKAK
jgi:hypothetical protein